MLCYKCKRKGEGVMEILRVENLSKVYYKEQTQMKIYKYKNNKVW